MDLSIWIIIISTANTRWIPTNQIVSVSITIIVNAIYIARIKNPLIVYILNSFTISIISFPVTDTQDFMV